jgi:DNA topoisomerase III
MLMISCTNIIQFLNISGSNSACAVHEWSGTFKNEAVRYKMTSVCGHVMSLDFTGKYNNWDKVDPIELFGCPTEKKEAMPRLRIPAFLAQEAKGCDFLILWLDCDKEGENICFEVS